MARNYDLPTIATLLIALATKNVAGMKAYAVALAIKLITLAECEANLAAFVLQNGLYNAARSTEQNASDAYQATLPPIYDWLLGVSNSLATRLGTRWSTLWAQAGFINHSTAVPTKIEDRISLVLALVDFFTANPGYEVANMNQTAAYGKMLRDAAVDKQGKLAEATINLNNVGTAWDGAYNTLRGGMRSLLRNLSDVLAKDDPRWLAFGFDMPSAETTPGQPLNVIVHLDETGTPIVQCDRVPLATRYRFRRMIVGVETDYVLAASSLEPIGSIKDVLPGQTVQIIVQAVNGRLQGVASDPIQFTIPVVSKDVVLKPAKTSASREVANGSANGHANGSRQPALS